MHHSPPGRGRVCAVLVTYHPDGEFPARLRRVLAQVDATVVVDNGSLAAALDPLAAPEFQGHLSVVRNGENRGIAYALNAGIQHAVAIGASWALLLDQDTEVDSDLVSGLIGACDAYDAGRPIALVGSRFRDTHGQDTEPMRLPGSGSVWQEVESVITSGSLLSLAAYASIGPFREDFFIDYVDTEYCWRAHAAGFGVIQTRRTLMSHTVGDPTPHRMFGSTKWTTNHSPDRRYYIARNNTVLLREYGRPSGGSWRLKSAARCLRLCKRIALFEDDKLCKIVAVAQGWWHGLTGRMGPRREADPRP